jgi:CheY-like chemotaxis protein/anti-sigma regulatory factor (Ser/Thr protein kinase)
MPYLKLDPQRIRQILFNLVGNAMKFTDRGVITVHAAYKDGVFTMSVTDTGCGIAKEDIERLMQPYVQLGRQTNNNGTGLGLSICKHLANQMKGSLEVSSVLGNGSTFTLRIPEVTAFSNQEAEAYFEVRSMHKEEEAVIDASMQQKQILIVDDSALNLAVLKSMLGRLNIRNVVTACNGKDALEKLFDNKKVEIVLTDMFMPIMDGEELVKEIRKLPEFEKLPVYAITADVEMQNTYTQKGFDNVLLKPVTLEKLRRFLA